MFSMFPLLFLSFLFYTGLSFSIGAGWDDEPLAAITMVSGARWEVSGGDVFLLFSFVLLFIEILRSTGTGTDSIVNHVISALAFICGLFCFLIVGRYATSTFFLLVIMMLIDMLAGFVITIRAARRDFGVA